VDGGKRTKRVRWQAAAGAVAAALIAGGCGQGQAPNLAAAARPPAAAAAAVAGNPNGAAARAAGQAKAAAPAVQIPPLHLGARPGLGHHRPAKHKRRHHRRTHRVYSTWPPQP
jgi:hypothetical protein